LNLRLKYHNSIADAIADLGRPEDISTVFVGFQQYLYQPGASRGGAGVAHASKCSAEFKPFPGTSRQPPLSNSW